MSSSGRYLSYGDRVDPLRVGVSALVVTATAILLGALVLLVSLLDLDSPSTGFGFRPLLVGLCVVTLGVLLMRALARAVFLGRQGRQSDPMAQRSTDQPSGVSNNSRTSRTMPGSS